MAGELAFGTVLRQYRRRAGLSQEELAERAFVSTRAISDLERGVNARPRRHTAGALADGLGLVGEEREEFERRSQPDEVGRPPRDASDRARPPLPLDSYVDDGTCLRDVLALIGDRRNRVVTLLGPGGVGKTRLAIEAAHRLGGPVAFVPLAAVHDAALLAPTVVDALGAEHGPSRTYLQSLCEHIGAQRLTLVLDNCEQLVEAAGDVTALVSRCPALTVVVTSRVPLRTAGEVRYAVRPLVAQGDDGQPPGVRLFLDRAAAVGASAGQLAADVPAIAELCDLLDGLPLAIELAAARSRIVSPGEMLARLDEILDLLGSGRNDAPAQHRSMRAALEWSHRLLPPAAGDALGALSVFPAGASVEAATAVWGLATGPTPEFYDLVQSLADAHLVVVDQSTTGGSARLRMFETTRQFAREKLDESDAAAAVRRRFTEWALALAVRAEDGLMGTEQLPWLDHLDRELPNLRAAAQVLVSSDGSEATEDALLLGAALQRYWYIRSRWNEGVAWLSAALERPGGSAAARAKAHKARGVMHRCLGDLASSAAELDTAVELFTTAGDDLGTASCLNNLGVVALDSADYGHAAAVFQRALDICARHGDVQLRSIILNNASLAAVECGQPREAFRLCRASHRLMSGLGDIAAISWVDDNLGSVLTTAGHPAWAVPLHHRAIRQRLKFGDENGFTWSLEALAAAWTSLGDAEGAGRLLGFVAAHRRRLGALPVPHLEALTARRSAAVADRIGDAGLAAVWAEGAALAPEVVRGWFDA